MNLLVELNLTQEELFVLLCCRNVTTGESIPAINDLITKKLDWDVILNIVRLHGIAGLLYVTLSQCSNIGYVPDDLIKKLATIYRQNALRNLLYTDEFNEISTKFNHANIRLIPLKGIAFLHSIYAHNIALRSLTDLDILVEKKNVSRAEKTLLEIGYKTDKTGYRYSLLHFHSLFWRTRGKQQIIIELHWDVDLPDSPFKLNIEEFWERSRKISSGKFNGYGFSIEDSIIFNSFHLLRGIRKGSDAFMALKNFCDIATIIVQSPDRISWDCIIERSRKYNILRPVALVLLLVQELLGVKTLPPVIAEILRTAGYREELGVAAVKEYVFRAVDAKKTQLPFWVVDLASQTTVREKIKVILNALAIMMPLYKLKNHAASDTSIMRTVLMTTWSYINKIIKAMVLLLYVMVPGKTRTLRKKLIIQNQKNLEVINWIRG